MPHDDDEACEITLDASIFDVDMKRDGDVVGYICRGHALG